MLKWSQLKEMPPMGSDMNGVGMAFFKNQNYDIAAKVLVATTNPDPKNYLLDYFYMEYSLYFDYVLKADKEPRPNPALLVRAGQAFAKVNELAPSTEAAFFSDPFVGRH